MAQAKPKSPIALEFAGFWRRLGAYIIDTVVLGAIFSFFEPLFWPDFGRIFDFTTDFDSTIWMVQFHALANLMSFVLSGVYFVIFWIWRGQTLGMMVAGIKVIRTDGSDIDVNHGILRYVGYIVSIIPLFLGFLWITIDTRKQGWHDKIADTVVVKLPPAAEINHAAPPTAA